MIIPGLRPGDFLLGKPRLERGHFLPSLRIYMIIGEASR
ncbi:hypothetical protein GGR34_000589 [Microvirga flocculans]|uniref:Uncharacterized protein n=1 Tax=Microvirga flocculans TaxID=217168 RepID=A0A7W6IDS0_9HYPH|nr:hypothetical protein [Microvirga flocculans]